MVATLLAIVYFHLLPGLADSVVSQVRAGASGSDDVASVEFLGRVQVAITVLSSAAWAAAGIFVFARRSHDLFGVLVFLAFVSLGILADPTALYAVRSDPWAPLPVAALLTANAFVFLLAYSFPDGRFVPRWTVLIAAFAGIWPIYRLVTEADPSRVGGPVVVVGLALILGILLAWLYRFRLADAVQREQMKWVGYGLVVFLFAWTADNLTRNIYGRSFIGSEALAIKLAAASFHALASLVLVSTLLIAMFRQGLLDIDLVINRTGVLDLRR